MNTNIYRYHDGAKDRYGDPMRINRVLSLYMDGSPKKLFEKIQSQIPEEAVAAVEQFLEAGRQAFELAPFNAETGEGILEADIRRLVHDFWEWCKEQKKNGAGWQTSPAPTVSQGLSVSSNDLPTWAQETPTQPSSASG